MKSKSNISIGVLILFHLIGLTLFILDDSNSKLSWLNMLVCSTVLLINEKNLRASIVPLFVVFLGGFAIEWIGTTTGWLFGNYQYGSALGPKIVGVPPIIGFNWICIILASVSVSQLLLSKGGKILKALLAAFLAVFMDFLIEPVAMRFDMWQWENDIIPVYNYICWFGFSFLFALIYLRTFKGINRPAQFLYLIWALFFLAIHLIL
jgi:bisanhydrobacterioruberin hydratase